MKVNNALIIDVIFNILILENMMYELYFLFLISHLIHLVYELLLILPHFMNLKFILFSSIICIFWYHLLYILLCLLFLCVKEKGEKREGGVL